MSSILSQVFSSKLIRGSYPDEKPDVEFQMSGTPQEKRRMTSLINRISRSSAFGKTVLENAAKAGYSIAFETLGASAVGSCCEEKKRISLSPMFSDSRLISTLAHEGRHAEQFAAGTDSEFGLRTVKSEIMLFRAMEADAQAAAAMTVYEMKNAGDKIPWHKFTQESPDIAGALKRETLNGESNADKMLGAAFKGWYDDTLIKEAYEQSYIVATMEEALKKKKESEFPYSKQETSEEIVNKICRGSEGCYFKNEPDVLEDPQRLDIGTSTLSMAMRFFSVRKMRTGQEADPSLEKLPVRAPKAINPICSTMYVGWGSAYDLNGAGEMARLGALRKSRGGR